MGNICASKVFVRQTPRRAGEPERYAACNVIARRSYSSDLMTIVAYRQIGKFLEDAPGPRVGQSVNNSC